MDWLFKVTIVVVCNEDAVGKGDFIAPRCKGVSAVQHVPLFNMLAPAHVELQIRWDF